MLKMVQVHADLLAAMLFKVMGPQVSQEGTQLQWKKQTHHFHKSKGRHDETKEEFHSKLDQVLLSAPKEDKILLLA